MTHIKLYMQAGLDLGCMFKQRTLRLMTLVTVAIAPGIWQPQPGWLGKIKHHGNKWNTFFFFFSSLTKCSLAESVWLFSLQVEHRLRGLRTPSNTYTLFQHKEQLQTMSSDAEVDVGPLSVLLHSTVFMSQWSYPKKTIRHVLIFL